MINKYIMVFLLIGCFLYGCAKKEEVAPPIIRPIKAVKVEIDDGMRNRTFSGVSKSRIESKLSFRVTGMIIEMEVKMGQHVAKGEVLAKIDDTDYRLQVEDIQASFQAAETDLQRMRQLYETNNISKQQLDQSIAQRDSTYAKLELYKKHLSYTVLHAPIEGFIAELNAEVHETVSAGQPIMTIDAEGDMEVAVSIPDTLIRFIAKGDKSKIVFVTFRKTEFPATVTEIGVSPDVMTKTYPVTLRLDKQDNRIKPGMTCDVIFRLQEGLKGERLLIPSTAVMEDREGNNYVWVYGPDTKTVHKRKVTIGSLTEHGIEIISGLKSGEIVASAGVDRLEENEKVKLLEK